jgi:hypothetical protein
MDEDPLKDPEIKRMLHDYTKAIEQEYEASNPSVDDTPEELSKKARALVIKNLPILLGRATGLALTSNSDSVSLSAVKFLYNVIIPPSTPMPGEPDPITKLFNELATNDKKEQPEREE